MSTHAKKSPSKFERIMLCPGSQREESKYPESRSGAAAIDGTHTHTLLEACLIIGAEPMSFINQELEDHDGKFIVDGERCNRVKIATDYINKRRVELNGFVKTELKFSSIDAFGRDDMGGTCDVMIVGEDCIEIIDYKDGMGEVTLPCVQIDIYSLMGLSMMCSSETIKKIKIIRQTIIQPKLKHRGDNGIISMDTTPQKLLELAPKFVAAAEAADQPDAPLLSGAVQCKYCKHKGACNTLSGDMLDKVGVNPLDVAQQAAGKDPHSMTATQIRELLEAAPLLRQLLESVEVEALRRMEAGETIEGLKVVAGRGSRSWGYSEDEMAEKLKKFGLPKDVLWKTSLITPAQAEKVVWTKRDGTPKQLTDRQLKLMSDEYIKKSSGKLTVALASDTRPVVVVSAANMFPVVPELPSWLIG
jgi:hypothetical protein